MAAVSKWNKRQVFRLEAAQTAGDTELTTFRACFAIAGVTNSSDFVSMDPAAYGGIVFSLVKDGTPDQQLNAIQVK